MFLGCTKPSLALTRKKKRSLDSHKYLHTLTCHMGIVYIITTRTHCTHLANIKRKCLLRLSRSSIVPCTNLHICSARPPMRKPSEPYNILHPYHNSSFRISTFPLGHTVQVRYRQGSKSPSRRAYIDYNRLLLSRHAFLRLQSSTIRLRIPPDCENAETVFTPQQWGYSFTIR